MKPAALMMIALTTATASACGPAVRSTPVPVSTPAPIPQPQSTFQTRDRDRVDLLNDFATLDATSPFDLPFRGKLNYAGHLSAALSNRADVIGDLAVTVDVGRGTIDGVADNFTDRFNSDYAGELELFNGRFDENPAIGNYQSQAGVRGTLRGPFNRDYAISGQLEGDVLGRQAQGYEAVLSGAVKVNGGAQEPIKGGAVAQRR